MNLGLSSDQKLIVQSFSGMLERESTPARIRAAEPTRLDRGLWAKLVELGTPLIRVPEDQGGAGMGIFDALLVAEQAGRHLATAPVVESIIVGRILAGCRTDRAREWLEALVGGRAVLTLALGDVETHPRQVVAFDRTADAVIYLRRDDIVLEILSRDSRFSSASGSGATAGAGFIDLGSETAHVIASGGSARTLFLAALEERKLLVAGMLCGIARRGLELAASYARERSVFGKLIGSYQGVAHPLADSVTDVEGSLLTGWRAVWTIAQGRADAAASVSIAAWSASQSATRALLRALHVFGGYGVSMEYDIQLFFRRGRELALLGGDPAGHLADAAERLWGEACNIPLPPAGPIEIDFDDDDAARALGERARAFFKQNMDDDLQAFAVNSSEGYHPDFFEKLAQAGLLFPDWPAEYGGVGCSQSAQAALRSAYAEYGWSTNSVGVSDMVGKTILRFGSEEAQREILPKIASGRSCCCLGYSEPSGGSDIFSATTRASRDGDHWIVDGQKIFTTMAHMADYVLLIARTDATVAKHAGLTLFAIPLDLPGFEAHAVQTLGGERTNITYYSGMRVPDRYRVGDVDGGAKVLASVLTLEQGGAAGQVYLDGLRLLMKAALDWAGADDGSGEEPMKRPNVRLALARVAARVQVQDVLTRRAFWAAETGCYEKAFGPMAKLFGSEAWVSSSTELMDLTAPASLVVQTSALAYVELDSRRSLAGTVYGGVSEVQRSTIAESALSLPRSR